MLVHCDRDEEVTWYEVLGVTDKLPPLSLPFRQLSGLQVSPLDLGELCSPALLQGLSTETLVLQTKYITVDLRCVSFSARSSGRNFLSAVYRSSHETTVYQNYIKYELISGKKEFSSWHWMIKACTPVYFYQSENERTGPVNSATSGLITAEICSNRYWRLLTIRTWGTVGRLLFVDVRRRGRGGNSSMCWRDYYSQPGWDCFKKECRAWHAGLQMRTE